MTAAQKKSLSSVSEDDLVPFSEAPGGIQMISYQYILRKLQKLDASLHIRQPILKEIYIYIPVSIYTSVCTYVLYIYMEFCTPIYSYLEQICIRLSEEDVLSKTMENPVFKCLKI